MTSLRAALCFVLLFPLSTAAAQPVALDDYLQMRRSLEAARDGAARAALEQQAAAALDALLGAARRSSRLVILTERRGGFETGPALETARLVAREGRVTLEALAGPRPQSPDWERAGVVEMGAYLAVLDRLLRDPALAGDWPAPGDRGAAGDRGKRAGDAGARRPALRAARRAGGRAPGILPLRASSPGPLTDGRHPLRGGDAPRQPRGHHAARAS